jgi:hypothetical protein
MSNEIQIVPLSQSSRDITRFLKVSYPIYEKDPNWVAPLLMDLKKVFTQENPLFQHARMQLWIARQGQRDVGRIAGIVDDHFNRTAEKAAAFFGFFESVDSDAVSQGLFEACFDWARRQNAKVLQGPMNPTTNDECGLLVEGFDSPPFS